MPQAMIDQDAFDGLMKAVNDLADTVQDFKRGTVDKATVERIAQEVMAGQRGVARRRNGPIPGSSSVFDGEEPDLAEARLAIEARRLRELHGRERVLAATVLPASVVSEAIGRPEADVRAFHEASDRLLLLGMFMRGQAADPHQFDLRETSFYRDVYAPIAQAMDTQTVGEGKETVPTLLSGSMIERVNLELMVAPLFLGVEMPSNPFDIPGMSVSRTRTAKVPENTADTGQTLIPKRTVGTRKVTLTAAKFATEVLLSREYEEDSLIAALPLVETEIVDWISADIEDTIINGDSAGGQDSDVTASDDPRKNWPGLRKLALAAAKSDAANAALTAAMLRTNRKKMGKYGVRAAQLAHLVSMAGYIQLLSDTATLTLEKYGPQAVVLTGELARVDGVPVIVSEYVRADLNASGVFDNVTTNRSEAITVNRRSWFFGNRRDMTVQVLRELYAEADQDGVIATARKAFQPRYSAATEPIVAVTFNTTN